jgi:hypothetical protein
MATAIEIARENDFVHDGDTVYDMIVSTAKNTAAGVAAENKHIERVCGRRERDWTSELQILLSEPDGRHYDLLRVRTKDGTARVFVFDITSFFGSV